MGRGGVGAKIRGHIVKGHAGDTSYRSGELTQAFLHALAGDDQGRVEEHRDDLGGPSHPDRHAMFVALMLYVRPEPLSVHVGWQADLETSE